MCSLASQTLTTPPDGSWMTAIRPASMTSKGSATTRPPSSRACSAVASTDATVT